MTSLDFSLGTKRLNMKTHKILSILTAASCALLPSCTQLEACQLYSPSTIYYVDANNDDSVQDDTYCRVCSCKHYERVPYHINSVCWCGHTRQSHSEEAHSSQDPISPLTVNDGFEFEVFVPAENLIAAYKEAVELNPNKGNPDAINKNEVYSNVMYIPAEGGSYEFEYLNESFRIASVYDSSIPPVNSPFSTRLFKTVNSLSYNGPYYSITCDREKNTWKIVVDPMAQTFDPETRSIYVLMWTSSQYNKFVFRFKQCNSE